MFVTLANTVRFASIATLALMAACDMQSPQQTPPPRPVSFNPPGTALAALSPENIVWFHVEFESGSIRIGPEGRQTIVNATESMQGNTTTATVVGKADSVGSGAANMRLSRDRAVTVRQAMLATGKVSPQRIETRWTGDRSSDGRATDDATAGGGRVVDIGIH